MLVTDIYKALTGKFGDSAILEAKFEEYQPFFVIEPDYLEEICFYLRDTEGLYFDFLHCLSGIDYGEKENRFGVVYHLYSLPYGQSLVLKCFTTGVIDPETEIRGAVLPTVSKVWRSAEWHEREAYDLVGIRFLKNDDLRRMFMPEDWKGHPLQKEYKSADSYHGIPI